MEKFWSSHPFVRIVIAQVFGILLGFQFVDFAPYGLWLTLAVAVIYLVLFYYQKKEKFRKGNAFQGSVTMLLVVLLFATFIAYQQPSWLSGHFLNKHDIQYFSAVIEDEPSETANSVKAIVSINQVKTESNHDWAIATGSIQVYFEKDTNSLVLKYGDEVFIKGRPKAFEKPVYKGSFDWGEYMATKQVYSQLYVPTENWGLTGNGKGVWWLAVAYKVRSWTISILQSAISQERELGTAQALLIGERSNLDPELRQSYADTGAMHVLAVSGLHVGILIGGVLLLFRRRRWAWQYRLILFCFGCCLLWGYALITGLSASVVRAATMYTVLLLSEMLQKKGKTLNTIAFSAFLLLMINPYYLLQVGFQLSYLAVIGIVVLQPRLVRFWVPKATWMEWTWQLTCVSLAAQIATFPISVYYFHQFPVYFWLSNLFVINLAFLIVWEGVLIFVLAIFSNSLAIFAGSILEGTVWLMNEAVQFVKLLPGAVIWPISVSGVEVLLLYMVLLYTFLLFVLKSKRWLWYGCVVAMIFCCSKSFDIWTHQRKSQFMVGVSQKGAMYAAVVQKGGQASFVLDATEKHYKREIKSIVEYEQVNDAKTVTQTPNIKRLDSGVLMTDEGAKLLWWKSKNNLPPIINLNVLCLSGEAIPDWDSIKTLAPQQVWLLGYNRRKSRNYVEKARQFGLNCRVLFKNEIITFEY
ncbi:ComEC/Rec2 family competence protein [Limibacter armeniacum]|uniref:ComEC/Rec2 family competence protein n=1 Tax=Limibacter armeniacum TaxID=466084 RepID=UPI002FE574CF